MVIGNGLLAKTFAHYKFSKEILIFASGVSNSTEIEEINFQRERLLLNQTITKYPKYKIVYFSTISVEDPSVNKRPYVQHKLQMENVLKQNTSNFLIFRTSNVVGVGGNKKTIMNYLVNAVKTGEPIQIWTKAERNLIDQEDVKKLVAKVIKDQICNKTINIGINKSVLVTDILILIENYLAKKANVDLVPLGEPVKMDVSYIASNLNEIEMKSGSGEMYIKNLLCKYY